MPTPTLLAIGGAHIDRRGQSSARFVAGASNPGIMHEEVGGAAFNTIRAACRFGVKGAMLSARGGDPTGDTVAAAIETAGLADLSVVHLDRATPSYTALIDHDGELIGALADVALYELAFAKIAVRATTRQAIAAADAVLVDTNIPSVPLKRIVESAAGKPVFANAVSPARAVRLKPVLANLACLLLNAGEAAALTGLPRDRGSVALMKGLERAGVESAVITHGDAPVVGFDKSGAFSIPVPKREASDVTGAGDALAGATIAALMGGTALADAVRHGIAAALTVAQSREVAPAFSREALDGLLAEIDEATVIKPDKQPA